MGLMTHQQARNMIQASVDHPLSSKGKARLDAHLAECGDCRRYAEHLRILQNDLHRVMHERWYDQHANVSFKIIQARSRRLRMRKTIWNTVKVLGAIALLATFIIVVNSFLRQPGSSTAAGSKTPQEPTTSENASPSPQIERQTSLIPILYSVQQGDTCLSIAAFFNVSVVSIIESNNLKSDCSDINPGQILRISIPQGKFQTTQIEYVVRMGDTLLNIATLFNVSVSSIVEANNLKSNSFVLYPGQILIISIASK